MGEQGGGAVTAHGLGARRRQIDDRESPVPQRDPAFEIDPVTVGIGSAVGERPRHARERR